RPSCKTWAKRFPVSVLALPPPANESDSNGHNPLEGCSTPHLLDHPKSIVSLIPVSPSSSLGVSYIQLKLADRFWLGLADCLERRITILVVLFVIGLIRAVADPCQPFGMGLVPLDCLTQTLVE